ncbi:hypothetical protein K493DRAFT_313821 [Basidiobolus meristosporus CBS 931.73]|uniref:Uncharacterized protein n=1 Tax=Basidiobolus meristosporus CBS 931.73 TaxID=1314790 RepID=A0A1Y1YKD2_9FUNG|nr:hypothetical protein K493DRAFT_313821 [Basidiobolus meristosporus CBS 931.73]|eukprot:ORX98054.1 hypothetical protein K493DRAFT_313821 [Basidiobolus meristosporus CBS 931.73]
MNSHVQTTSAANELESSSSSAEPTDSSLIDNFMFGLASPASTLAQVQQLAVASASNSLKRKPDLTHSFLNSLSTKQSRKDTGSPTSPTSFRFVPQEEFVQLPIDQKLNAIYAALRDMSQTKVVTVQSTQPSNPSINLEFHPRKREILQSGIFSGQELAPTNNTRFQKELVTHFQLKLNENRGNARKKALAEFIFSDVPITEEQLRKAALMRQIAIKHGYMTDPTKDENFWTTFHEIHTSICSSDKASDIFETILIEDQSQFSGLDKP